MIGAYDEVGADLVGVGQVGARLLGVVVEDSDLVHGRVHDRPVGAVGDRDRPYVEAIMHSGRRALAIVGVDAVPAVVCVRVAVGLGRSARRIVEIDVRVPLTIPVDVVERLLQCEATGARKSGRGASRGRWPELGVGLVRRCAPGQRRRRRLLARAREEAGCCRVARQHERTGGRRQQRDRKPAPEQDPPHSRPESSSSGGGERPRVGATEGGSDGDTVRPPRGGL